MTPAQRNDSDELPIVLTHPRQTPETPEQIEGRARAEHDAGHGTTAAHLRGYAHGIREGERRAGARIVKALRDEVDNESAALRRAQGLSDIYAFIESLFELANDIEAGRL